MVTGHRRENHGSGFERICRGLKRIAEDNSNAYYECSVVDAILTGNKIISIVKEIEVLEWIMMIIIFLQKY